jgi:hypothetical protein
MKNALTVVVVSLLLVFSASFALPLNTSQAYSVSSNTGTSWITAGTFLNYSVGGSFAVTLTLSNGSKASISGDVSGTYQVTVNSVQNGQASITTTPNVSFSETTKYFNGTSRVQTHSLTQANATTATKNLGDIDFGNQMQNFVNQYNSTYFFSPHFNASKSISPGYLYSYKSTNVVAIHVSLSMSAGGSLPVSSGFSSDYSINGTLDYYRAMSPNIPLKLALSIQGSADVSGLPVSVSQVSGASATASGSLTIALNNTNVALTTGNAQQGSVNVPALSASLDVVSNSTITGVGTSGNKLVVNVTGPSGTTGVMNVIITQRMLERANVTNINQIGIVVDGNSYFDYTVGQIGDAYIFTIYYHHSSHTMDMTFGSAKLGSNTGSVSSIAPSGLFGLTYTTLAIIAAVVVIIVIVGFVFITRRSKISSLGPVGSPRASPTIS